MNDDMDQDDVKRKSRNLSEKKRRDQFNLLVNELNSMVLSANRKLDKSTVLQTTIAFLKQQDEKTAQSRVHEIQENWKPSFLSNEEFTHLMLEAVSGFIIVLSSNGQIQYASESIITLMGHLPSELIGLPIYDFVYEKEHQEIYSVLSNPTVVIDPLRCSLNAENQVSFSCYLKKGGLKSSDGAIYEQVQFVGFFRYEIQSEEEMPSTSSNYHESGFESKLFFVGIGRLQTPQLVREMSAVDSTKSEFTSRQSLEWKFLFLDHRATPIIGYLPFEVLGTSGYDYYHFDDLDNIAKDQEALMIKGGGTSCYYRFLTKSQQWIWLQTHSYLTYHQWTSKPEFVVCTHRIFSYADVLRQQNNEKPDTDAASKCRTKKQTKEDFFKTELTNKRPNSKLDQNKHLNLTPTSPRSTDSSRRDFKRLKSSTLSESSLNMTQTIYSGLSESPQDKVNFEQSHNLIVPSHAHTNALNAFQSSHALSPTYAGSYQHAAPVPVQFLMSNVPNEVHPSAIPPQHNVIMNPAQSQIQNQLQRKHEELQQAIYEQQKELQRVAEQLQMARYESPSIANVQNYPEIQAPYFVDPVDIDPIADRSVIRHVNLVSVAQYPNENEYQTRTAVEIQIPSTADQQSDVRMENITDHLSRVDVQDNQFYRDYDYSQSHPDVQWPQHSQIAQQLQSTAAPHDVDGCNLNSNVNENHVHTTDIPVNPPSITDCQSVDNSSIEN